MLFTLPTPLLGLSGILSSYTILLEGGLLSSQVMSGFLIKNVFSTLNSMLSLADATIIPIERHLAMRNAFSSLQARWKSSLSLGDGLWSETIQHLIHYKNEAPEHFTLFHDSSLLYLGAQETRFFGLDMILTLHAGGIMRDKIVTTPMPLWSSKIVPVLLVSFALMLIVRMN